MPYVPKNQDSWLGQVKTANVGTKTIHSFESPASGSKIGLKQFLLLRVLWVKNQATKLSRSSEREKWNVTEQHIHVAREHLKAMSSWVQYKSTISKNLAWHQNEEARIKPVVPSQGMLTLLHQHVQQKTRAPEGTSTRNDTSLGIGGLSIDDDDESLETSDDDESPETEDYISPFSPPTGDLGHAFKSISDEQIVNTALLLYLEALLINFVGIQADWTPERHALVVKRYNGQKVYEARLDGFLRYQRDQNNPIMAIVEVKPFSRDTDPDDSTRKQESAQMAAWICQHPPTPAELTSGSKFSRLLVSQDRHHIYLTFAEFDAGYVDYIRDTPPSPKLPTRLSKRPSTPPSQSSSAKPSFLKMNEYGPFETKNESHMDSLGQILLAFSLQACEIREKADSKAQTQK
ncbi:hypothetical protein N7516_010618 [Penicillium verrucosum]|uniref:uncharacterized protein n=1 Tax=Penicillium verrucosum TaxID=60171 RepID=UPI002544E686|nr:uncharacterized protein N7516_010618 [Penicillium verrucosum]KAJ5922915.1 hypothetical protein N7516_010618 [Penicillium verrucosum]